MKTINVKKDELLNKLNVNLVKHKEMVVEAKVVYKKILKEKLKSLLDMVEKDEPVNFYELTGLSEPVDKTEEYEQAIEMLKMEVNDEVEVSQEEFRNFVQDKWNWTGDAMFANTRYLKS